MECVRWAAKWRSAEGEHILYEDRIPMLFRTRAEARAWIELKYGCIRTRQDLKVHPYYWKLPIAVKVSISFI